MSLLCVQSLYCLKAQIHPVETTITRMGGVLLGISKITPYKKRWIHCCMQTLPRSGRGSCDRSAPPKTLLIGVKGSKKTYMRISKLLQREKGLGHTKAWLVNKPCTKCALFYPFPVQIWYKMTKLHIHILWYWHIQVGYTISVLPPSLQMVLGVKIPKGQFSMFLLPKVENT